jgi:sec-independent protein translocase protein TatA
VGHIGMPELILVLVIFLVFFGASKLPQAGQALGSGIRNFKKAMNGEEDIDVTPKKKKKKAIAASSDDDDDEDEDEEDDEKEAESAPAAVRPK